MVVDGHHERYTQGRHHALGGRGGTGHRNVLRWDTRCSGRGLSGRIESSVATVVTMFALVPDLHGAECLLPSWG